jgi:hypothetical protein
VLTPASQRYVDLDFKLIITIDVITNNYQSLPGPTLPSKVGSSHEAHQLIGKACKLRVEYQEKKADSLRRLQELLDEVKWIDDKILEVDIHIGRIYHVVDSSGFEIPPPNIARREHTVVIEGGT